MNAIRFCKSGCGTAVHRLQNETVTAVLALHRGKHRIGVGRHVAGFFKQFRARDVRRDDRLIAALEQFFADKLSSVRRKVALGSHNGRPAPTSGESMNKPNSRPSLRWSRSLACSKRSICASNFFGWITRAVQSLQLLIIRIAAPIRAGDG